MAEPGRVTGNADAVVRPDETLLETMRAIDRAGLEVALVCDRDGKLLALATDGDIRRGLLRGLSLSAPVSSVANHKFSSVSPGVDRAECVRLMLQLGVGCLPVVDSERRLLDLLTLRQSLAVAQVPSWALIMAGGRGERLGELTEALPKPMLPIGDRPILERLVQLLVSHGVTRIFISINYLGSMIIDHFGAGEQFHCRIEYIRESQPLGTAGAIGLLPERPRDPLLVLNGDLVTGINVARLLSFHRAGGYQATMVVRDQRMPVPFGVADLDGSRVLRIVEKPSLFYHINAGIYVLEPALCARVLEHQFLQITDLLTGCIDEGMAVGAYVLEDDWVDIGLPHEYLRVHRGPADP